MHKTDNTVVDTGVRTHVDSPSAAAGRIEISNGRWIDLLNPKPEDIHLEDVTISLSRAGRFGGFTSRFYSVASHTILCVDLARLKGGSDSQIKAVALHDFHEAYVGDIPSPLKKVLAGWKPIVDRLDQVIGARFDVDPAEFDSRFTREVDHLALSIEAYALMHRQTPGFEQILLDEKEICRRVGEAFPTPLCLSPEAGQRDLLATLHDLQIR